jgi:hypothetical protein
VRTLAIVSSCLAFTVGAAAQQPGPAPRAPSLPAATTDTSPFRRLDLPTPTSVRTGSGAPGKGYWQQRADYVIRATLDTAAKTVTGQERITYSNNSPDTLRYVWLQVDQNLFRQGSRGSLMYDPGARFGTAGASGGYTLTRVAEARPAPGSAAPGRAAEVAHFVNGTVMRLDLVRPLPPGAKTVFELAWSFPFGPNANRMGLELVDGDWVYEVAQWYPRMAVYDDVRGWNSEQYYGQGEFYLEYGRFDVSLTVPANMIVAATGTLRNPEAVLTSAQRARLAQARTSDSTIVIRSRSEIGLASSRPAAPGGMLTWRFTADSVRDFAWAAASHFIWDAARANGGRTVVMSFYPPAGDSLWKSATQYGKTAIEGYSAQWFPYPYPYASNVNGIEGGMEYPMIVFCANRRNIEGLYGVTDHEFGHTWFPMVVGSNERLYPWMDEGFNSFINYYNFRKKFGHDRAGGRGSVASWVAYERSGQDREPPILPADRTSALGQVAYNKPAVGLVMLRDRITSPERFDPVFREYIRRWAFKHPTPADFFRTMNDGLGEDLDWFWRSWFYTTGSLDQSVDSVRVVTDSSGARTSRIYLANLGPLVMPVDLALLLDDGSRTTLDLPVEVWFYGNRYTAVVPGPAAVVSVVIDPDTGFVDLDRTNNQWPKPVTP